ncbi:hypothetical protein JCM11641_003243 [Rhodosporidiobolus odoratus]
MKLELALWSLGLVSVASARLLNKRDDVVYAGQAFPSACMPVCQPFLDQLQNCNQAEDYGTCYCSPETDSKLYACAPCVESAPGYDVSVELGMESILRAYAPCHAANAAASASDTPSSLRPSSFASSSTSLPAQTTTTSTAPTSTTTTTSTALTSTSRLSSSTTLPTSSTLLTSSHSSSTGTASSSTTQISAASSNAPVLAATSSAAASVASAITPSNTSTAAQRSTISVLSGLVAVSVLFFSI